MKKYFVKVWLNLDHYFGVKWPKTLNDNLFKIKKQAFDKGKHGGLDESNFLCINK